MTQLQLTKCLGGKPRVTDRLKGQAPDNSLISQGTPHVEEPKIKRDCYMA